MQGHAMLQIRILIRIQINNSYPDPDLTLSFLRKILISKVKENINIGARRLGFIIVLSFI